MISFVYSLASVLVLFVAIGWSQMSAVNAATPEAADFAANQGAVGNPEVTAVVRSAVVDANPAAGGRTSEVVVEVTIKNTSNNPIVIGRNNFSATLVKPDGENHRFAEVPPITDAHQLQPGKEETLEVPVETHTEGVDAGKKYRLELKAANFGFSKSLDVVFKKK